MKQHDTTCQEDTDSCFLSVGMVLLHWKNLSKSVLLCNSDSVIGAFISLSGVYGCNLKNKMKIKEKLQAIETLFCEHSSLILRVALPLFSLC